MEASSNEQEKGSNSESFSYSWYPTQCEISTASTQTATRSLSQESFHIMKTDGDEEVVIVEPKAPEQASQNSSQYMVNIGNKFTDQQVRVLMKAWKELYDKRQHIRTCESDWHDITDKVNMAPGSAKTIKQVKKKFKNLRDRYRAFKVKNRKRNFGFSKSLSFTQFEQVYGEIDHHVEKPRQNDNEVLNMDRNQGGSTLGGGSNSRKSFAEQIDTSRGPSIHAYTKSKNFSNIKQFGQGQTMVRPTLPSQPVATASEASTAYSDCQRHGISRGMQTKAGRAVASPEANGYQHTTAKSSPRPTTSNGAHPLHAREGGQLESGLVNAVRELQQQQITMQREIMRGMKQMEERLLLEISTRLPECEDRFRQQIANAFTQLGNLIRIT